MIKYKLIKNYPQFEMPLECHSIADGEYYTNKGVKVYNPENHPEFWELVVKKNYEILTVNPSKNHTGYPDKKAIVLWNTCYKDFKYWEIHSVKRLSDGEIFTIGDKVNDKDINYVTFTIERIRLTDSENIKFDLFHINQNKHYLSHYYKIDSFVKVKQPLFTTEDGVDIKEGDVFYGVWKDCKGQASHLNSDQPNVATLKSNSDGMFTFSTKEAAETFINLRKPYLSNFDVLKEIDNCTDIQQIKKIFTNKVAK